MARYDELYHFGKKGQKHGVRQYQYADGSLTPLGREHYGVGPARQPRPDASIEDQIKDMQVQKAYLDAATQLMKAESDYGKTVSMRVLAKDIPKEKVSKGKQIAKKLGNIALESVERILKDTLVDVGTPVAERKLSQILKDMDLLDKDFVSPKNRMQKKNDKKKPDDDN